MYDELIAELRQYNNDGTEELRRQAADSIEELVGYVQEAERDRDEYRIRLDKANDAIEELEFACNRYEKDYKDLCAYLPKWIPIESRPMDEEERKEWSERIGYDIEYEDAVIYTSKLPDDGQEVLVCNKWGHVWIDTFSNDPDYGVGFETNGDMDGIVAWMPKPKPYEPPKEET